MMQSIVVWLSFWLSWYNVMFLPVYTEEETIKDGNMTQRGWDPQGFKPMGASSPGESWGFQEPGKTCGVGSEAELWFITDNINLNTTFSEAIHVDVEAELTSMLCYNPANSKNIPCYSNSFEVYINPGIYKDSSNISGATLNDLLQNLALLYTITNSTHPHASLPKSTQTFSFKLENNLQIASFVVRSRGACGKIFRMKMYYYYCGETFTNGIKFERTLSPLNEFKIVSGKCSVNSIANILQNNVTRLMNPKSNCSDNGTCSHNSSEIVPQSNANCSDNGTCSDNSSDNSLKNKVAPISPKQYCYNNGTWSLPVGGKFTCSCDEGFSLNKADGSCSLCSKDSYRKDISTDDCIQCPDNTVANTEKTSCSCRNGFHNISRDTTTMPCYGFPIVRNLTTKLITNGVNISWIIPDNNLGGPFLYDVQCFICNQTVCNTSCTNEQYNPSRKNLSQTWVVVSDLSIGDNYVFKVYARNGVNDVVPWMEWNYTETEISIKEIIIVTTPRPTEKPETDEDSKLLLYIIIGVGSLLLLILIAFLIIYVIKRRRHKEKRSRRAYLNEGVELPDVGRRLYVDPSNYDDAQEAVLEFANELDPKSIFLERMIGGGAFGDVYKGELTKQDKKKIPIAVKTLKHDANEKSSRDFMLEASVMGQFDDPNVVRLEGVITKSIPRMIVLEYMVNGSLDNYLKSNDCMLTDLQLIGMARGVAAGMKYLSEINFVHRDLAARNVLVNEQLFCKIADFGLSRELEANETSRGEYSTSGGKIPVRWTAPEAVKFRKFSSASDVWSFGILLWEIMSFAERPYWQWDNYKVLEQVDQGFRLPLPYNCPKGVHDLMLHCWKAERNERPSFAQITIVVDGWIRSPETMEDEISALTKIGEWLTSLKMNSYEAKFVDAGYKRKSEIIELTDEDLQNIGVSLIGHRNKILKGINRLKSKKKTDSLPV